MDIGHELVKAFPEAKVKISFFRIMTLKSMREGQKRSNAQVIGGGATGAGVALDSQTRGLKTALVELDDYSSGTSSR